MQVLLAVLLKVVARVSAAGEPLGGRKDWDVSRRKLVESGEQTAETWKPISLPLELGKLSELVGREVRAGASMALSLRLLLNADLYNGSAEYFGSQPGRVRCEHSLPPLATLLLVVVQCALVGLKGSGCDGEDCCSGLPCLLFKYLLLTTWFWSYNRYFIPAELNLLCMAHVHVYAVAAICF